MRSNGGGESGECQCSFRSFDWKCVYLHTESGTQTIWHELVSENVSICDASLLMCWCWCAPPRLMCRRSLSLHSFGFYDFHCSCTKFIFILVFRRLSSVFSIRSFVRWLVRCFSFYWIVKTIAKLQSHFIVIISHHIWMGCNACVQCTLLWREFYSNYAMN